MKSVRILVAAVLASAAAILATGTPAQAYPDPVCTVSVSPQRIVAGSQFTATVTSTVATDLSATYRGVTKSASDATRLVATFNAGSAGSHQLSISCGGEIRGVALQILPAGANVDPDDNAQAPSSNGILPNTGGLPWILLVIGAVLVVAGGAVAVRRRA